MITKRDYIFRAKLRGSTKTIGQLATEYDNLAAAIPADAPPAPVDNTTSPEVAQHDAVEAWLINLRNTDPDQFDKVRRRPFAELVTLAGA